MSTNITEQMVEEAYETKRELGIEYWCTVEECGEDAAEYLLEKYNEANEIYEEAEEEYAKLTGDYLHEQETLADLADEAR